MLAATARYIGPAAVLEVDDQRLLLEMPDGPRWARLALAMPYEARPGDVVLAGGEEDVYVIGVLHGTGPTCLNVPADFRIQAGGRVQIIGTEIELSASRMSIKADKLEIMARTVFEKLVYCYRWVKELIQTRAGRERTLIEGHQTVKAERIIHVAEKDVKIDGAKIHLG